MSGPVQNGPTLGGGRARAERAALERFGALVGRCEHLQADALHFDELRELAGLYRRHIALLARARERADDPEVIRHLNALCVRAYTHLAPRGPGGRPAPPLRSRALRALAATWRPQLLAWALLALGAVLGIGLARQDPAAVHALMPGSLGYSQGQLDRLIASPEERASFLRRDATPPARNLMFGSLLFANNTRAGLVSFATGVLAGVPTAILQLYNGLVVGSLGWVFFQDPWPTAFLAWIMPHGIPEFAASMAGVPPLVGFIAKESAYEAFVHGGPGGGFTLAGLVLGSAVVRPGRRGRVEALRAAVEPALLLVGIALPFFVLAAAIESFVRESALGATPRFAVVGAMATLVVGLLAAARRADHRLHTETGWLLELSGSLAGPDSDSAERP